MSCRRNDFFLDLPGPGLAYLAGSVCLYGVGAWMPSYVARGFALLALFFTLFWLIGTIVNNVKVRVVPDDLKIVAGRVIFATCLCTIGFVLWQQFPSRWLEGLAFVLPCWALSWITGGYTGTRILLIYRRLAMLEAERQAREAEAGPGEESVPAGTEGDAA